MGIYHVFLSGLLAVKKQKKNEYFPKSVAVSTRNWHARRTENKI